MKPERTDQLVTCNGAAAMANAIADAGIEVVFGLPGVQNLAAWPALDHCGIRVVGVRHEQAAAYAADGYARVTGRCGVALTTTGPGAANAVAATGEAWACGVPIVVIATDIPSSLRRPGDYRGVLHECTDQASLFTSVTKERVVVEHADQIYASVVEAIDRALDAPSGPVYVQIPSDFLRRPSTHADLPRQAVAARPDGLDPKDLLSALACLETSQRPLIWAGGGVAAAGAGDMVAELSRRLGAPVISTYAGRGVAVAAPEGDIQIAPHFPLVGGLWDRADCVLAVGSGLDGMMTQNWAMPQPQTLVLIDVAPGQATANYGADVVLRGDASATLALVLERLPAVRRSRWSPSAAELRAEVLDDARRRHPRELALVEAVQAASDKSNAVFADLCIAGYWVAALMTTSGPRRLAYPMGWGTLGYALQGAIGAAVVPGVSPVVVCGDGGVLFGIGELATLAQENLPITVVIVDDCSYGMLKYDQLHMGERPSGVDLRSPAFDEVARGFGLPARVAGLPELGQAIAEGVASGCPNVVVLRATLQPPPTVSINWYRAREGAAPASRDTA